MHRNVKKIKCTSQSFWETKMDSEEPCNIFY